MMYRLFCAAALCAACLTAAADVVAPNDVTVFQPGTTIESSAVNSTISALIDAIDDNAARIAALESASSSLVAGRSYALRQIGVLFRGNNAGGMTVANLSQSYIVDFDEANGFSFVGSENEGEVTLNGTVIAQSLAEPVSFSGSYVQTGSTLALTIEGDPLEIIVAMDGRVLLISEFDLAPEDDSTYTRTESSFVVGVEISD